MGTYGSARRARARRALVSRLKRDGATASDKAQPLVVADHFETRELERMIRKEVVRKTPRGGYWLDLERYADWRRQNLLFAIGAVVVTIAVMVCILLNDPESHRSHAVAPAETTQVP